MKPHLREFTKLAFLAVFHFGGTYFAVAALFPQLALQAALIAAIAAMLGFLFLWITDSTEHGLPIGLLYLFPVIYITIGIAWWLLRLLGLWPLK